MTSSPTQQRARTSSAAVIDVDTVVVGLDGEPAGASALAWVERQRVSRLHLVHAISPTLELLEAGFQIDDRPRVESITEGLAELAAHAHRFADEVSYHVLEEQASIALVDVARGNGAAAIVVGSRGRHGHGTLVGTNVGRLIHRSDVPVIVVPEGYDADGEHPSTVVVAVDDIADVAPLLDWVGAHVAPATPVEVLAAMSPTLLAVSDSPQLTREIEQLLAQRLEDSVPAGFRGEVGLTYERSLEAYASASERAGMLVLASRHQRRVQGFLTGSASHHLPSVSACPVALVPLPDV